MYYSTAGEHSNNKMKDKWFDLAYYIAYLRDYDILLKYYLRLFIAFQFKYLTSAAV